MTNFIAALPHWSDVLVAIFAISGSILTCIGAWGLVRLPTFFDRLHGPALGTTLGCWCIVVATIIHFSVREGEFVTQAILIAIFIAITTPITIIFLMRATLFRKRLEGRADIPPNLSGIQLATTHNPNDLRSPSAPPSKKP